MGCCGSGSNSDSQDPCSLGTNTAACETLPSTIDNFIKHFFGTVVKTESGGVVTWSLPCNLDTGLPNNPRGTDEGLACYFLRLFDEGITGLIGPAGSDGAVGATGANAYTVTLASFTQPTVGSPNFSVKCNANPAILAGGEVFIGESGWHTVNAVGNDGTLFLSLLEGLSGAPSTITAGKIVVMTGPKGQTGATGATGPQGVQGDKGDAGDEYTPTHNYFRCSGSDHNLTLGDALVAFGGTEPEVTLPIIGDYLVEFLVGVEIDSTAATLPPETIVLKVWNATAGAFIADAQETVQAFEPDERGQILVSFIATTLAANTTLQLYANISVAGKGVVEPDRTSVKYVRLS